MSQDDSSETSRSSENLSYDRYLPVLSSLPYQAIRESFYKGEFRVTEDSPWPLVLLSKGSARGHALLMPPGADLAGGLSAEDKRAFVEMAQRQAREMGDLDADVLDALSALWLDRKDPKGAAWATVDDFLQMRGLKPKQKVGGRHSGYRPEQRREMMQALVRQQSVWVVMAQMETYETPELGKRPRKVVRSLQSRTFVITDRFGEELPDGSFHVDVFRFRPGDVFAAFLEGPGRQTALLSAKALKYDPYRQTWEKRLTRYLSWQWRVKRSSGQLVASYRVQTLLEAVGEGVNERYPSRTRERLESALDTLEADGVIAEWQYERWDQATSRGWAREWVGATVVVEPPADIDEQYRELGTHSSCRPLTSGSLGERVRLRRKELGLTQLQLAELLEGVFDRTQISKLESDRLHPTPVQLRLLRAWLGE